jgi:hypothetical protein
MNIPLQLLGCSFFIHKSFNFFLKVYHCLDKYIFYTKINKINMRITVDDKTFS